MPYKLSYVAITLLEASDKTNLYEYPLFNQISLGGLPLVPNTIGFELATVPVESVYVVSGVVDPAW